MHMLYSVHHIVIMACQFTERLFRFYYFNLCISTFVWKILSFRQLPHAPHAGICPVSSYVAPDHVTSATVGIFSRLISPGLSHPA